MTLFAQPPPGCQFMPPKYVVLTTTTACGEDPATSTKRVFLLGQPMFSPPPGTWAMQGGTCMGVGYNPIGLIIFNVGAEVPPDSFVAATPMIDP
jgi:hypothetical protein